MDNTSISYGPNNYMDILYFLSNSNINPHIDRIYFSCRSDIDKPEKILFSVLKENDYKCKYDHFAKGEIYKRVRRYTSSLTNVNLSIIYERNKCYSYYPCMGINIYKPDITTVEWFDIICNSLGFLTTLSHVELTMNFTPYQYGLQEFFCTHLFLKYHSGNVCFYGDDVPKTFYIGHKRKNSKSVIVYDKTIDGVNILRLEIRINRSFLQRHEVELCCFEEINNIDLSSFISFKQLNYEKLSKHFQWRHKEQISRLGERWRGVYVRQLMSYLEDERMGDERSVANNILCMKKSPYKNNCQRFLEDMPDANEAFSKRLGDVKFI